MATTIFRVEKHKSFESIRLAGAHQFRYMETPNADPKKYPSNRVLLGGNNIERSTKNLLSEYEIKPRKNAVLAMDGLMTLSPEALKNGENVKKFMDESATFLKGKFGKRCVSAVLHMDETSPHVHFTVIPIQKCPKKGYKLNARDMFNKSTLSKMQKEYFEHMKRSFPELVPPQHGCKATHSKIKSFYNDIDELAEKIKNEFILEVENNRDDILSNIKNKLFSALDRAANNKFVEARDRIGYKATKLIEEYESQSEEMKDEIFNSIAYESDKEIEELKKKVEGNINNLKEKALVSKEPFRIKR